MSQYFIRSCFTSLGVRYIFQLITVAVSLASAAIHQKLFIQSL